MVTCPACGRESSDEFAFCPYCGAPRDAVGTEAAAEVRKTVTVVFCDVTGSTELGERLDPEALAGVMARYFDEMERAVARHGGTVEKFIGDAVMAVFGVPTLHEDDALRAVRSAADMRDAMSWLNKELERDHGVTLAARIGVNTGEVMARRQAGPGEQRLVSGDAVNIAARLEQAAAPGEILVGDHTYRLVRDAIEAEPVDAVAAKGKSEAVPAFRLLLVHPHAAGVARRLDSPMVGRTRQLHQLDEAYRTAVDERACYLFTVLGAPGVGKSRLTEEFLAGVASEATVLRGRCLSYGQGITFFPIVDIVAQATGTGELEGPEAVRDRLIELGGGGPEAPVMADRLRALTGAGEAVSGTDELFWAVRLLLESLARRRPLVVVIDDIHWAEPTLLDLIEHVADWSRDAPILLVCPARPELLDLQAGWAGGKLHATTILLEPLAEEECEELIANLLGSSGLDEGVRRRIAQAAEGNPLFVEQMLAMLVDDGHLREEDGTWAAVGDLDRVAVPPTVSALLTARLDRLTTPERRVIERAAVEGKEFHAGSVAAMLEDGDRAGMAGHLRTLVRRELIRPHGSELPGEEGYRFRHQLIRDAAYEAIPKRTRADLHRAFAGWLADRTGDTAEFAEIGAYHLERSYLLRAELGPVDDDGLADARQAAVLLDAAGRRAAGRLDFRAADNLLERALALVPRPDPLHLRAAIAYARNLYYRTELHRGVEVAEEAIAEARQLGDEGAVMRAGMIRLELLQQIGGSGSSEEQLDLAMRAVRLFEDAGDRENAAEAWDVVASAYWGMARWAQMREPLERAAEHLRATGNASGLLSNRLRTVSSMFFGPTPVSQAADFARQLLEDATDHPVVRVRSMGFLGALLGFQGRFDEGWELIEGARRGAEDLGNNTWISMLAFSSGPLGLSSGRLDLAERDIRRSLEVLEGTGDRGWTATLAAILAMVLFEQGRIDEADEYANRSRDATLPEDVNARAFGIAITARVASAKGGRDEGLRLAREALELIRRTDELNHEGDLLVSLSWVADEAGERDEAIAALRSALDCYERKENLVGAAKVRERLAGLTDRP